MRGLHLGSGSLPPSEGPTPSIDFTNKARRVMASFPEVTQVVSQTGRPDDGTDTTGFFNTEYFVDLSGKAGVGAPSSTRTKRSSSPR